MQPIASSYRPRMGPRFDDTVAAAALATVLGHSAFLALNVDDAQLSRT